MYQPTQLTSESARGPENSSIRMNGVVKSYYPVGIDTDGYALTSRVALVYSCNSRYLLESLSTFSVGRHFHHNINLLFEQHLSLITIPSA